MGLAVISRYDFAHEAHIAKETLMNEGISAYVSDSYTVGNIWHYAVALGGVKLWVADEDIQEAQKILASDYAQELEEFCTQDNELLGFNSIDTDDQGEKRSNRKYRYAALLFLLLIVF